MQVVSGGKRVRGESGIFLQALSRPASAHAGWPELSPEPSLHAPAEVLFFTSAGRRMDSVAKAMIRHKPSSNETRASPERVRQRPASACTSRSTRLDGPEERRVRPASATVRGMTESGKEVAISLQRPASARPSSALSRGDSKQRPRPASALGIGANAREASVPHDALQPDDQAQGMVDDYLDNEEQKNLNPSQGRIHMAEVSEVLQMLKSSRRNPFAGPGQSQISGLKSNTSGRGLGSHGPASTKTGSRDRGRIDLDQHQEEQCQIDVGFFAFKGPGEVAYKFEGGRSQEYIKTSKVLPEGVHAALEAIFTRNRNTEERIYRGARTAESAHDRWRHLHASAPEKKLDVLKDQLFEEARREGTRIRGSLFRRKGKIMATGNCALCCYSP